MVYLLLLICTSVLAHSFCGSDKVNQSVKPALITSGEPGRNLRAAQFEPIRIKFEFLPSVPRVLLPEDYILLNSFFAPRVAQFFANWVRVQRRITPVKWDWNDSESTCRWYAYSIPQALKFGVSDADLVILVNVDPTSDIGVVGFAGGCAFDEDHRNMPIIGFMNLYADSWQ